jgi:hypothetical protein
VIDGSFVPEARPTVGTVELEGEAVLLDEATGSLHLLNPVATVVWACFDGSGTIDELVADLSEAFGADAEQVRDDVVGLATELAGQGLLVGVPGAHEHDDDDNGIRTGDDDVAAG